VCGIYILTVSALQRLAQTRHELGAIPSSALPHVCIGTVDPAGAQVLPRESKRRRIDKLVSQRYHLFSVRN
jgi:hypothetical protein